MKCMKCSILNEIYVQNLQSDIRFMIHEFEVVVINDCE